MCQILAKQHDICKPAAVKYQNYFSNKSLADKAIFKKQKQLITSNDIISKIILFFIVYSLSCTVYFCSAFIFITCNFYRITGFNTIIHFYKKLTILPIFLVLYDVALVDLIGKSSVINTAGKINWIYSD